MNKDLSERSRDFLSALSRLEEALGEPEDSFLRDASIRRFEFTYELAWRAIKLWLESKELHAPSATEALRAALDQGLLVDRNGWSQLQNMRSLTSHTYDEAQALRVYHFVKTDGVRLLAELAKNVRAWGNG